MTALTLDAATGMTGGILALWTETRLAAPDAADLFSATPTEPESILHLYVPRNVTHGIQDDECFDTLVQKGLLQDIINLATALEAKFEVVATPKGWRMTVANKSHTLQLEKTIESLELAVLDLQRTKQYPCDAESTVGAAIDLMKAVAHQ